MAVPALFARVVALPEMSGHLIADKRRPGNETAVWVGEGWGRGIAFE